MSSMKTTNGKYWSRRAGRHVNDRQYMTNELNYFFLFGGAEDMALVLIEPYDQWLHKLLQRLGLIETDLCDRNDYTIGDDESEENDYTIGDDESEEYLINLDPKEWKSQDHYKIFNVHNRFFATPEDIKKQYRLKVLRHHPDKRSSGDGKVIDLDLDYYSCLTKAYEILGDAIKRRSYDSIDETFDDEIPANNAATKADFYRVYGNAFKLNSRWSTKQPVPELGDDRSDISYVNKFYAFWYDFDSWREYSYLDEEEKEKGENRDERRWMEKQNKAARAQKKKEEMQRLRQLKQNKAARAQKKKEEMQRLRQLVDNAYQSDPRIARFKEEEKQKKLSQKLAKQQNIREKQLEEERVKREAEEKQRLEKLEKENEIKAKKNEEKKQKDFIKKEIRKERKHLETLFETFGYFADNENQRIDYLREFDKIMNIYSLEELQTFRQQFEGLDSEDSKRDFFLKKMAEMNTKLESERIALLTTNNSMNGQTNNVSSKKHWSYDDIQLLIKAIKLFPAGTQDRWAVI
ncbi:unnamed protein product, partial [Medioppia subpectinata]